MAASCPLPVTPDLPTLRAKLHGVLRFLREALPISNAHTVDFYTESVWEQLVDLPPETVLAVLRRSAAEAEAQPSAARPLAEAQGGSGERGGAGREAERRSSPAARGSVPPSGSRAAAGARRGGAARDVSASRRRRRRGSRGASSVSLSFLEARAFPQFKKKEEGKDLSSLSNSAIAS